MAYLLIPLCRGDQGGSSGRDDVGNGGLWWPEWTSERARVTSLSWLLLLLPSAETTAGLLARRGSFWQRRGGARWSETVDGALTERERERQWSGFLERETETERERERVAPRGMEKLFFTQIFLHCLFFSVFFLLFSSFSPQFFT